MANPRPTKHGDREAEAAGTPASAVALGVDSDTDQ
jgi:hypothetical protein